MQIGNFDEALDKIIAKDSRYNRDAYLFVREALDYTQKLMAKTTREKEARESRESAATSAATNVAGSETGEEKPNHVSGQELLGGIRALALEQFGPMALAVLQEWGIQRCEDFGEIVFNMVETICWPKRPKTAVTISRVAMILIRRSASRFSRSPGKNPPNNPSPSHPRHEQN